MTNIFQNVQTYQEASLALLTNQNAVLSTANTLFNNFNTEFTANLGDTITFDRPTRLTTVNDLVATFQDTQQLVQTLTVDQQISASYVFSNQDWIFNAKQYIEKYGRSAVAEIGSKIETDVSKLFLSNTYRFFGNGVNPINSYTQLAQLAANYRDFGAPNHSLKGYFPLVDIPTIIGSGLSQFVLDRNKEIANSWELGKTPGSDVTWYQSNQLPVHTAGNVGNNSSVLTFVSINAAGDQITMSGAGASDADALKQNDLMEFASDIRYRTYIGHEPCAQKVQVRVTADVASDAGGIVVIPIFPALIATANDRDQNITRALAVSDTSTVLPNHRAGALVGGNALFVAVPKLPIERPYDSVSESDPETGIALRLSYGSIFGQNQQGFINSAIWGKTLVDDYAMRIVVPLT